MPKQRRSLRARLIALVLIPSTALLALWGLFTTALVSDMRDLRAAADLIEDIGDPVLSVVGDLQTERRHTMDRIAGVESRTPRFDTLERFREQTDDSVAAFQSALEETGLEDIPAQARRQVQEFDRALAELERHRSAVDGSTSTPVLASAAYTDLIEAGLRIWDVQVEIADADQVAHLRSVTSLMRARELLNQEDALVAYFLGQDSFSDDDHARFAAAVGAQRFLYERITPDLTPQDRRIYEEAAESASFRTVRSLEDQVIAEPASSSGQVPINGQSWKGALESLDLELRQIEDNQVQQIILHTREHAGELQRGVLVISVPALAAGLASILFALAVAHGIGRRLHALRAATLEHAQVRLPELTARLRAGDSVDADTEAPRIPVRRNDEIGEVTEAFNIAQRAAVASAVEEAQLRSGVRNIFRNIARRTQALVHRQLGLLDSLEKSETDPASLESLFQIDHLSTQMRRNAENLMLLSGDRPTRHGPQSITLHEAVRAASSEIEDYARVRILPVPEVSMSGGAGGDVIRLLAELLENAASFSPPTTTVTVGGQALAKGYYALEVEDRGLGMTPEQLEQANTLLAAPPEFDLSQMKEDSNLGLFVVATVAERHGLQVTLRPSPYRGTQAIVVLPPDIIVSPGQEPPRSTPAAPVAARSAASAAAAEEEGTAQEPTGPAPAPRPATASARGADPGSQAQTYKGLPRRTRKRPSPPSEQARPSAEPAADQRPLEEIRSMMSALQAGTARGRDPQTGRPADSPAPEQQDNPDNTAGNDTLEGR